MFIKGLTFTEFAGSLISTPATPFPARAHKGDSSHATPEWQQAQHDALVENIGHMTTLAECHPRADVRRHAATLAECYTGDLGYIAICLADEPTPHVVPGPCYCSECFYTGH